MKNNFLKNYHKKRNFSLTSEPFGESKNVKDKDKQIFVIQKHDASRLHFDFRISVDGVLKSWAVPKGPSTNPKEKRLAVPTEDHPIEYADFEGTIPEDEYGGGTVMVWDAGTYENLKENENVDKVSMSKQIKDGHTIFWLNGKKLNGGYALTRTKKGKDEKWILVKMKDDEADARRNPVSTENKSVLTGRTLKQIKQDSGKNE
jgi:DNA ligase D-like protein (predicted 3'-phosphoesterase)